MKGLYARFLPILFRKSIVYKSKKRAGRGEDILFSMLSPRLAWFWILGFLMQTWFGILEFLMQTL